MGIFSLKGYEGKTAAYIADGVYENLLTGEVVSVSEGQFACDGKPIIVALNTDELKEREMRVNL